MKSEDDIRLLADIGGTNARFALTTGMGDPWGVVSLRTADYPTPEAAIRHYLDDQGVAPRHAALAVACPVTGDMVRLTNSPWSFSTAALKAAMGFDHLGIYNDFTAMVLSLPWLGAGDVRQVGGAPPAETGKRRPLALVGPGTGLGVSALLPVGADGWLPLESEGGHVGFAPTTPHEDEILRRLRQQFGRLSAERVISGMGIENVYTVASAMRNGRAGRLAAAEVTARARQGDLAACETLSFFSSALGAFAGDLVLTIGAWGGLYVGGGIAMRLGALFDTTAFNRGFENKGRYAETMRRIPRWLITREHPALLGLAHDLERVLGAA